VTTAEQTFALIARPDRAAVLQRAGRTWVDDEFDPEVAPVADAPVLDAASLRNVAVGLSGAAATRPLGDPVRAGIPLCRKLVRDRLADPELLVAVGAGNVVVDPGRSVWQLLGAGLGVREYRSPDATWTRGAAGTRVAGSRNCGSLVVIAWPWETLARSERRPGTSRRLFLPGEPTDGHSSGTGYVRALPAHVCGIFSGEDSRLLAGKLRSSSLPGERLASYDERHRV
jgi:hypothetical protein